jgi:uncharacterized RDD family membrane protein YckC
MSQQWQSAPQPPPGSYGNTGGASGPRAGFWRRFAAMLLDGIVLLIPVGILLAIFGNGALYQLLTTLLYIAYYVYFEGGPKGQTVGKMALGIRVYDFRQGGSIGYGRAFVRYIARILSAIPLFLGYFWMLWDKEKQCWHDKLAASVVVPVDAYR